MKEKIDYIELVIKTIMWILGIIVIYMLVLKIAGHSPTLESILLVFVGIIGTNLLFINYKIGKQEGKFNQFEYKIKDSFERMKKDLEEIKRK